eukprot:COSAG02_NODE_44_length_45948_cov_81.673493_19_plen_83_part_00
MGGVVSHRGAVLKQEEVAFHSLCVAVPEDGHAALETVRDAAARGESKEERHTCTDDRDWQRQQGTVTDTHTHTHTHTHTRAH